MPLAERIERTNPERKLYHLHADVGAIKLKRSGAAQGEFVTLPTGTVLELLGPSAINSAMREFWFDGNHYALFLNDLNERATRTLGQPLDPQ